jgi:hypothetical protein
MGASPAKMGKDSTKKRRDLANQKWLATLDGAGCDSNLRSKYEVRTLKVVLSLSFSHSLGIGL